MSVKGALGSIVVLALRHWRTKIRAAFGECTISIPFSMTNGIRLVFTFSSILVNFETVAYI